METDIIVTCPYDKSHRIRKGKLTTHLIKCRKQNDRGNKITCPLSNGHIIDPDRLKEHIESCSNLSTLVESYVVEEKIDIPPIEIDTPRSIENWDESPEVPTYNPMEQSEKRKVIRCVSGLTKSERKQFRENEQIRIAKLNANDGSKPLLSPSKNQKVHEVPLRPPRGTAQALLSETESEQRDSNKQHDTQTHSCDTSVQTKPTEFRNTFHRTLYNELSDHEFDANQEDNVSISNESQYSKSQDFKETKNALLKKLWETHCSNGMVSDNSLNSSAMFAKDYSQDIIGEDKKNVSICEDYETRAKKEQRDVSEIDASYKTFDIDSSMNASERIEGPSNANISTERHPNKLLALLKYTSVKEEVQTRKDDKENKHEMDSKWEQIMRDLNDRLADLTGIQNAASEQRTLIAQQLNELKMLKSHYILDNDVSYDPRYAANFPEHTLPQAQFKNDIVPQNDQTFDVTDEPSSSYEYGACGNSDKAMLNVKGNEGSKLHELKTPNDFRRHDDSINSTYSYYTA